MRQGIRCQARDGLLHLAEQRDGECTDGWFYNDFLRRNFYSDKKYSINTDGNIDSAIKENDRLLAIIEAKAPQNKPEMPTCDNMNKKALWESVYCFLERAVNISKSKAMISSDSELRRIIITDGLNWFLIDSSDIHAVTDGAIERRYLDYKNGKLPLWKNTNRCPTKRRKKRL